MSSDELEKISQPEYFQRLKQLQGMGFGNDAAADALHEANFDVELAVQYLTDGNPFRMDLDKGTAAADFLAEPPFLSLEAVLDGMLGAPLEKHESYIHAGASVTAPTRCKCPGTGRERENDDEDVIRQITLQEEDKWAAGPSSKKPQKKMPPPEIPKSSPPKPKPEQLRDLRLGIIGAGFTGLLLAHGLRRHGGIEPSKDSKEVHLIFEPGHLCHKVDIVVGADGADSMVRRFLVEKFQHVDPEPVLTPYVEEIALMSRTKSKDGTDLVQKRHPIQTMASDKEGLTTIAVHQWQVESEERAHELIQMSRISVPPGDDEMGDLDLTGNEARRYMAQSICKTALQDLEPWRTYVEALREPHAQGRFTVRRVRGWNPVDFGNLGGLATLAGDAAHVMLPFGGRGLLNSTVDANALCWAIKTVPRPGATPIAERLAKQEESLDDYGEGMRQRAGVQVRKTLEEAEKSINLAAVRAVLKEDSNRTPVCIYQ
ncbi:hypothetical protein HYQ45_017730 [Verticillium longisporum]|uniref:UBA domain-containing protein n=2 Tax=Verticillium TaxID=1036719 RepID=A0A8I2Z5V5_VERLO|nr:hypothetical protein HYQ45_017730 [Verticillium longisporum]